MEDTFDDEAQTLKTEVVSFTHNGGNGSIVLLRKMYGNFLHTILVKNDYVNACGNSISIVAKIQVAGGEGEILGEVQHSVSNENFEIPVSSHKSFCLNMNDGGTYKDIETVIYSSGTDKEFAQFEVSRYSDKKRVQQVDIKMEIKNGTGTYSPLLLHTAGTRYTPAESFTHEIQVNCASSIGLVVDLKPVEYSSRGRQMRLHVDRCMHYQTAPSTKSPYTQLGDGGGRRRTSTAMASLQPRHSSNSGEQNFDGLVNSSGITDGVGNNSIFVNNYNFLEWQDWYGIGRGR